MAYMGRIAETAAAGAVAVGCKVLPIFGSGDGVGGGGAAKKAAQRIDGKKAVARVKELLRWAAQARPHTPVSARKWKKVLSFQNREAAAEQQRQRDGDALSSSSGKLSFKWDAGSCSSASAHSPLSFASAPAARCASRLSSSSPQSSAGVHASAGLRSSSSLMPEERARTGQWITTDSDFVVLEL